MIETSVMIIHDERHHVHARVCACVGLTNGATTVDVVTVMDYATSRVVLYLKECHKLGYLNRVRVGKGYVYHLGKQGRRYVDSERRRVVGDALAMLARARLVRYARLSLIDELETHLRLE